MSRLLRGRRLLFVGVLSLGLALPGALVSQTVRAQTAQVQMVNATSSTYAFQPATLTVTVGTTVTWTNNSTAAHTVTSDSGAFDSGVVAMNGTYSFMFTQPGTYPYHCSIHPYMTGQIVVQSAATAAATGTTVTSPSTTATASTGPAATAIPMSAYPVNVQKGSGSQMGPARMISQMAFQGYYDAHKDTYLSTDVSSKVMATAMHIRYAPGLTRAAIVSTDPMYLIAGRAAAHQLAVFGSQPGEADYSPLWQEVIVKWRVSAHPVLLTSDNQIFSLQKKGKLTLIQNHVILNCPIVKVGKG